MIFGRSDVMEAIGIKPSRASELLREMAEHGIIEPVSGHGKGKYRFRQQAGGAAQMCGDDVRAGLLL